MELTPTETSSPPVSLQPLLVKLNLCCHTRASGWLCSSGVALDRLVVGCIDDMLQLSSMWFHSNFPFKRRLLPNIAVAPQLGGQTIGTFKSKLSSLLGFYIYRMTLGYVLKWHVICASCLSGRVSFVCLVSPTPSVLWDRCPSGLSSPCSIGGIEANLALRLASTVLTGSFSA